MANTGLRVLSYKSELIFCQLVGLNITKTPILEDAYTEALRN